MRWLPYFEGTTLTAETDFLKLLLVFSENKKNTIPFEADGNYQLGKLLRPISTPRRSAFSYFLPGIEATVFHVRNRFR